MRDLGEQMIFAGMLVVTLAMVAGTAAAAADSQLVKAAKDQDHKRVRDLVNQHVDVNVRAEDGSTALLWPRTGTTLKQRVCYSTLARTRTRRMTFE